MCINKIYIHYLYVYKIKFTDWAIFYQVISAYIYFKKVITNFKCFTRTYDISSC